MSKIEDIRTKIGGECEHGFIGMISGQDVCRACAVAAIAEASTVPPEWRERIRRACLLACKAWDSSWLHGTDEGRMANEHGSNDAAAVLDWLDSS